MGLIRIKTNENPYPNTTLEHVYSDGIKVAVSLKANEGYELVRNDEEPSGIIAVDIPCSYEERLVQYSVIEKIERSEEE